MKNGLNSNFCYKDWRKLSRTAQFLISHEVRVPSLNPNRCGIDTLFSEPFGRSRYEIFIGHWLMVNRCYWPMSWVHTPVLFWIFFHGEGTFITQKKSTEGPRLLRVWYNLKPFCSQYSSSIGPFLTIWSSFRNSPTAGHLTKNNPKRFQGSMTCQRWKVQCVERVVGGGRCSIAWFTPRVVEQTFRPHPEQPLPIDMQQTIKGIHLIVGYADCLGCVLWVWYLTSWIYL